jgi:hypothetical protein
MLLLLKYFHPRNVNLTFSPLLHKYTLNKGLATEHVFSRSVSSLKQCFFPESANFDAKLIISQNLEKWKRDPTSKYYDLFSLGKDNEEVSILIETGWMLNGIRKSQLGTSMHMAIEKLLNTEAPYSDYERARRSRLAFELNNLEAQQQSHSQNLSQILTDEINPAERIIGKTFGVTFFNDILFLLNLNKLDSRGLRDSLSKKKKVTIAPLQIFSPEITAWVQWRKANLNLEPIASEWSVYSEPMDLAGQIDAVFVKRDEDGNSQGLVLIDWKRVEHIELTSSRKGRIPFDLIPDTNFGHYCCQLNYYTRILERHYDMKIGEIRIVQIHPSLEEGFKEYIVPRI